MNLHITQLCLALVEGLGLIASPCILPILPIMLAASLDGGKKRPLGIISGFIFAFTVFALLSRQLLLWLHADPGIIRDVALVVLVLFGLTMLSKKLSDKLLSATQGLANFGQGLTARWDQQNGYFSGVAIGALIGLIWAPCAGPIMAAAVVQIIQAKTNLEAVLTVIMFAIGAGVPMLIIALLGRQIMSHFSFLKTHSYGVRRALGIVIILAAALIYEGADVQLLASTSASSTVGASDGKLHKALDEPYPSPEIVGIKQWLNSPPLKIGDLRGKVVLVDFWTYSCVNCVRTLPYITAWDARYRDKGLVIIGVHAPEFEFEKNPENVKAALEKYGIHYPVALDSDLATWTSFHNQYWPAHYLIDQKGQVVYTHFGEGDYDVTENNIRVLLGLHADEDMTRVEEDRPSSKQQTQETYLGAARAQNFENLESLKQDADQYYSFPKRLPPNHWALSGDWQIGAQRIKATSPNSALRFDFTARKVFLVMGASKNKAVHLHVLLNGKPANSVDVHDGNLMVDHDALYQLIDQKSSKNSVLEIRSDQAGLEAYAFTFGG